MTPLDITLGCIIVFVSILWIIDSFRWANREKELLDRVMAKHYPEYIMAEQARKETKQEYEIVTDPDILPVT